VLITLPPAAHVPAAPLAAQLPATAVVEKSRPAPHGWASYTVRPGDTLIGIATRFRTTPGVLASRNHVADPRALQAGARIQVPRTSAPTPARPATRTVVRVHTVAAGETLSGIAARYGTSIPALVKTNHLADPSRIYVGQRVVVGHRTTVVRPAGAPRGTAYVVRRGDTLSEIAVRHHTTVTALAKASRISPGSVLRIGQRLTLPARAGTSSDSAAGGYSARVTQAAARNRALLAHRKVPTRTQTRALVIRTARAYGVDPRLALAIAYQESGWNQRAVSPANAIGIMQVIPAGGQWASDLVGRRLNLLDATDNVTAGVVMLRTLERATGRTDLAVAAYYQGLGALRSRGMYAETRRYVANVTALRKRM
jgi:LysM repeat protein